MSYLTCKACNTETLVLVANDIYICKVCHAIHDDYNYIWLVQIVDRTEYDKHITADGEGYPSVGSRL